MRAALLTAQKMAGSIVQEAEKKRDELLAEAETKARERIGDLQNEVSAQQQRLSAGQQSLAEFIRTSKEACEKQLAFLEGLPELPVQAVQPPEEEKSHSVEEIEEQILAAYNEEQPAAGEPEEEKPAKEEEQNPFLDDATRTINLDDLKFGRNYNGGK